MAELNEKGLALIGEMMGKELVEQLRGMVASKHPTAKIAEILVNDCFGDVWLRPGLDRKQRSLITIAFMMGCNRPEELRHHIKGGLANGVTQAELMEIIIHAVPYLGLPAAGSTIQAVMEVMSASGAKKE